MWIFSQLGVPLNIILITAGIAIGCISTIVGLGGGFILVPVLLLFFHFSPQYAVGTSIMVLFFNALSAVIAYRKQKRIDYRIGLVFGCLGIPGTIVGGYLSKLFSAVSFSIFFGTLLLITSLYLLRNRCNGEKSEAGTNNSYKYKLDLKRDGLLGFSMGLVASIAGIGGGIICMPLMVIGLNIPVHIATATSMFIITFLSLSAFATHTGLGHVNPSYGIPLIIGTVVGAQIGAHASNKMDSKLIKNGLAVLLLLTAVRMIVSGLYSMLG